MLEFFRLVIHILRHAEAEAVSATGLDDDRRLTEAGRRRMRLVAKAIARLEPGYHAILVSSLVRAVETAEPVAHACGFTEPLKESKALRPGADPHAILEEISRLRAENVLLVGHMPHLGRLLGRLLTGRDDVDVPMKKAALAAFETADPLSGAAELKFYFPPRLLEKLA